MSKAGITDKRYDEYDWRAGVWSTAVTVQSEFSQEGIAALQQKTEGHSCGLFCYRTHLFAGNQFLINLIDSPGDPDFSSEVTTCLRVADGALFVVECMQGVSTQTEAVLRQALYERIKLIVFINKVDLSLLEEPQSTKEELYHSFLQTIQSINDSIVAYHDPALGDIQIYPDRGMVAFGSGLHKWGFTLRQFARRYAKKFGVDEGKLMEKLWGDHYFDSTVHKWTTKSTDADGNQLERGFCMFVLDPIFKIFDAVLHHKNDLIDPMLLKLGITLREDERTLEGKDLLSAIMQNFLPCGDSLVEMTVIHLPSAAMAQQYRVETLYEGPMNDESAMGIRDCNPSSPLVFYVSRMVPTSDGDSFYAFGRVFSGTVRSGLDVRIRGQDYRPGASRDLVIKPIQGTVLMMGDSSEPIDSCPAGNIVGLVGIDPFLLKSGTLTTSESAHNIRAMKFCVSPFIQIAIEVKNPADLPKLVQNLQRMSKSNACIEAGTSDTGEHFLAGVSESQLEIYSKACSLM